MKARSFLSYLLIITGLLVSLYPIGSQWYSSYWQDRLLEQWEQQMVEDYYDENQILQDEIAINIVINDQNIDQQSEDSIPEQDYIHNSDTQPNDDLPEELKIKMPVKKKQDSDLDVIGIIKIEKINAHLPILEGTDKITLKKSIGHLKGTAMVGDIGNAVLAGHRSHSYGKMFNRLDEVEIGDEIIITAKDNEYRYIVYNKKIVEPNDISVIKKNNNHRILTLITCHPLKIATHRLIIQGEIK